jgi:hypothetical protein
VQLDLYDAFVGRPGRREPLSAVHGGVLDVAAKPHELNASGESVADSKIMPPVPSTSPIDTPS